MLICLSCLLKLLAVTKRSEDGVCPSEVWLPSSLPIIIFHNLTGLVSRFCGYPDTSVIWTTFSVGWIVIGSFMGVGNQEGLGWGVVFYPPAILMGICFVGGLFGGVDAYEPPSKSSNSNFYKAASIHQRNKQQQELDELNEEVDDLNDRFDG